MNTLSASPAEAEARGEARGGLVWDLPVRLFHWLMAGCFAGAWLTAESERWRMLHAVLGWTMLGLVLFRIVWGFAGTRHARFASFVRGPRAVWEHLRGLVGGPVDEGAGHNPAGGWAVLALLALTLATAGLGWAAYDGVQVAEELHEGAANALIALVVLHLAAVAFTSWRLRRNLVRAMLTGRSSAEPEAPAGKGVRPRAVMALLLAAAVVAFWWSQWNSPPAGAATTAGAREGGHHGERGGRHHDDD